MSRVIKAVYGYTFGQFFPRPGTGGELSHLLQAGPKPHISQGWSLGCLIRPNLATDCSGCGEKWEGVIKPQSRGSDLDMCWETGPWPESQIL